MSEPLDPIRMASVRRITEASRNAKHLRPACRGIEPDAGTSGYYCLNCGYSLEPFGSWWRHGGQWIAPEVWTRGSR
jgi:hypothetical protein